MELSVETGARLRYAVLNQELDASSRREGDPIPDNEFSHFGAASAGRAELLAPLVLALLRPSRGRHEQPNAAKTIEKGCRRYTVRNYEGPDGAIVPPRVYFSANSNRQSAEADNNAAMWWGRFQLGLGFAVPSACWNAGSDVYDDLECTRANFPSETIPLTKLTYFCGADMP